MNIRAISLTLGALSLLAVAAIPTSAAPVKDKDKEARISEFRKGWADKDYKKKLDSLEALPAAYELGVPVIIEVLKSEEWLFRLNALKLVFEESDEACLAAYAKVLFDPKGLDKKSGPAVQEHLLWALYNNKTFATPENWDKLMELVRDAKTAQKVRVRGLRELSMYRGDFKAPEAQAQAKKQVEWLMAFLAEQVADKKADRLVKWHTVDALEGLTGQDFGDEMKSWNVWWNDNKAKDLEPRKADKVKDALGDIDIEGETFARKQPRGVQNMDLLILPEFGYSGAYWRPYVFELNKMFNAVFVDLPDASRLPGVEHPKDRDGNEDRGAYFYPLPQLVDAFERRREASNQKKVGILAHGVSGWIALQYARQKPESVAFVIVMNTWSSENAYGSARGQCESDSKDLIRKNYGRTLVYDPTGRQGPASMKEDELVMARIGNYKRMAFDPMALDPLLQGAIPDIYSKPVGGGQALVPKFDFKFDARYGKLKVPCWLVWGKNDWMYVKGDEATIGNAFDKPMTTIYENSSRTPWGEEPIRFFDDFQKLIKDYKIGQEDNKAKK